MTALTTEVLIFETNDAFRQNQDLPIPAFKVGLKADGIHAPVYYGKEVEEPSTSGYVFINWDSFEAHQAFRDGPNHKDVIAGLQPCFAENGKIEKYHVKFSGPTIGLEMPFTEVVIMTLKAPENGPGVVEILTKFSEASEKRLVFGRVREDANKYMVICGWDSVEAHLETAAKPEVVQALVKLHSLAHEHLVVTKLAQCRL